VTGVGQEWKQVILKNIYRSPVVVASLIKPSLGDQ